VRYQLLRAGEVAEFFTNDAADPSGFGEGQTFADAKQTTQGPGGIFVARLAPLPLGTILTATANAGSNTSEFSRAVSVTAAPPIVTASAFDPQHNTITFTFSKDVSASLSPDSLRVHNNTSGLDVAATGVTYDASSNTATFALPGSIPTGSYVATLLARSVADASGLALDGNGDGIPGDDYSFTFQTTAGDVNLDSAVNFADLLVLTQNYGQPATFAGGDLNHDGCVDFNDLLILAQNFGQPA